MKIILRILLVLLPINLFGQFTKSFTNVKEYRFSNKLLDAVESKSYNFAIIQHADQKNFRYESLMERWATNGDMSKSNYAFYTDRLLKYRKMPQIYGTQLKGEAEGYVFYPIENIDKIEELRMKMGLISIEKYARLFGINWSEYLQNQKVRD